MNGHVITDRHRWDDVEYCTECGEKTIIKCQNQSCGEEIRGESTTPSNFPLAVGWPSTK